MDLRRAEAASERRQLCRPQILPAENQNRMFGERVLDPSEGLRVERFRQIDADSLGAERLPEGAKFACGHRQFLR
jgi:hypothetical protein